MSKSPDAFRTISEVAEWLDTPTYVLRFWESCFPQIKPVKRAGGRRYYRPDDMLLLGGIKQLLHFDEKSIKEVKGILKDQGVKHVMTLSPDLNTQVVSPPSKSDAKDTAEIDEIVKTKPKAKKKPAVEIRVVKKAKAAKDGDVKPENTAKAKPAKADNAKSEDTAKAKAVSEEAEVNKEAMEAQDTLAKAKAEETARVKAAKKKAADEEADEWAGLTPDSVRNVPFRINAASAYDEDSMEEIETLYYSLRMARNSMWRAKKQQEKQAS